MPGRCSGSRASSAAGRAAEVKRSVGAFMSTRTPGRLEECAPRRARCKRGTRGRTIRAVVRRAPLPRRPISNAWRRRRGPYRFSHASISSPPSTTRTRSGCAPASNRCGARSTRTGTCAWRRRLDVTGNAGGAARVRERSPDLYRPPREELAHFRRASNAALQNATGDFVALLDHDDELTPDALFHVARFLNAEPVGRPDLLRRRQARSRRVAMRSVLQTGLVARSLPHVHVHVPSDGGAPDTARGRSADSAVATRARRTTTWCCG